MRYLYLVLVVLAGIAGPAFAQESIIKVSSPREVRAEVAKAQGLPKELEGLVWNRWTSKNFVVCSLNDPQAQYLNKHLELVKGWVFARWGLYDIDFSAECKLICVDDPALYKKLFNLDRTRVEIRRDDSGKIRETVIFLLIDGPPSQTVPVPLTEVCMAEMAQRHNSRFPLWAVRGMSRLNGTLGQIRSQINDLKAIIDRNDPVYFSKGLMEMDAEQYAKLDDSKKRLYDDCAMALCLMARKEFGQNAFHHLLKGASDGHPEQSLKTVLKFQGYDTFDRSFKRYLSDLTAGVASGKTPDSYLQIIEAN